MYLNRKNYIVKNNSQNNNYSYILLFQITVFFLLYIISNLQFWTDGIDKQ